MTTAAVIVAAGRGERMKGAEDLPPKQLRLVAGKPVLSYSVEFFDRLTVIDCISVVTRPELQEAIKKAGVGATTRKPLVWAKGGARRQDSSRNGVLALPDDVDLVAIHDAVRPFPPERATLEAIAAARECGGAILAVPVADTVKRADESGHIVETVDRAGLWLAQTPQVFQRRLLMEAFETAEKRGIALTDEASAFELMGWPVRIIPGTLTNLKITTREDLARAEAYAAGAIRRE